MKTTKKYAADLMENAIHVMHEMNSTGNPCGVDEMANTLQRTARQLCAWNKRTDLDDVIRILEIEFHWIAFLSSDKCKIGSTQ